MKNGQFVEREFFWAVANNDIWLKTYQMKDEDLFCKFMADMIVYTRPRKISIVFSKTQRGSSR